MPAVVADRAIFTFLRYLSARSLDRPRTRSPNETCDKREIVVTVPYDFINSSEINTIVMEIVEAPLSLSLSFAFSLSFFLVHVQADLYRARAIVNYSLIN